MSSKWARGAAAIGLLALLSGCVGVPTSGGVVTGEVLVDSGDEQSFLLPGDPVPGADPQQILTDFIRAANSSQGDYRIATKFLTEDFAEVWKPFAGVSIRTGAAEVEAVSETELTYTMTVAAEVDAGGRYRDVPAATQSSSYTFEQVEGEWRISSAPDGVILSANSFGTAFNEHPLYFFDPTYEFLVPDARWFPRQATAPTKIVNELLAGPSSWLQRAVVSAFPASTEPDAFVTIVEGIATVDLSDEVTASSDADRNRMRQQLEATLARLATTATITVDGLPLTIPDGGQASQNPGVESRPLIVSESGFGFARGEEIVGLPGLAPSVQQLSPTALTLAADQSAAAVRGSDGAVYVTRENAEPVLLDSRPGLVGPSIDPHGFVWSVTSANASGVAVFGPDGVAREFDSSTIPAGSRLVSFDISRDGTRVALYLERDAGPQLVVAGIVRDADNVPISFGAEPYEFALADGTPVDSAWVDNRTIVTISVVAGESVVMAFPLGGPLETLGSLPGASTIVGLNNGVNGIRVLADGQIWRRGSSNWVDTGITASVLATQQ